MFNWTAYATLRLPIKKALYELSVNQFWVAVFLPLAKAQAGQFS